MAPRQLVALHRVRSGTAENFPWLPFTSILRFSLQFFFSFSVEELCFYTGPGASQRGAIRDVSYAVSFTPDGAMPACCPPSCEKQYGRELSLASFYSILGFSLQFSFSFSVKEFCFYTGPGASQRGAIRDVSYAHSFTPDGATPSCYPLSK